MCGGGLGKVGASVVSGGKLVCLLCLVVCWYTGVG